MNQTNKKRSEDQADRGNQNSGNKTARVVRVDRGIYHLKGSEGNFLAKLRGRFQEEASTAADYPAVGDYVAIGTLSDAGVEQRGKPENSPYQGRFV